MYPPAPLSPAYLLAAGPAPAAPATLAAMSQPILHHTDPAFQDLYRGLEQSAGQLLCTRQRPVVLPGDAGAGMEAAVRAIVVPGATKAVNLVSGPFGRRLGNCLRSCGAEVTDLEVPSGQAVDPAGVEWHLDQSPPGLTLLSLVHCETPAGTVHDLAAIISLCRDRGILTLADCVSSLGGMEVDVDGWGLDLAVAAPHKCLAGPAGVSLIAVSPRAWQAIEANNAAPRQSCLSLLDWRDTWHGKGRFPSTPPVSTVYGVAAACQAAVAEGGPARISRHYAAARTCQAGAEAMGLRLWPATPAIAATCVTAIAIPDGLHHESVRNRVLRQWNVMLAAGHDAGNLVRIGHMGPTANLLSPLIGLAVLGQVLTELGAPVDVAAGLTAALQHGSAFRS